MAKAPAQGFYGPDGGFTSLEDFTPKRPLLFPFLGHLLHHVFGVAHRLRFIMKSELEWGIPNVSPGSRLAGYAFVDRRPEARHGNVERVHRHAIGGVEDDEDCGARDPDPRLAELTHRGGERIDRTGAAIGSTPRRAVLAGR